MAENLNENIDAYEEIARRRPELFGPINGRITQAKILAGSDDPDITSLGTITHQLGMAQMSAHSMRSAQGLESAAGSLTNSFHNSPEATIAALEKARSSVATFQRNSQNPGKARTPVYAHTAKGPNGAIGSNDGVTWYDVSTGKQVN